MKKIIAPMGLYYSGSSTISGFFNEFDNTTVIGYIEPQWSKTKSVENCSEICFFSRTNFFKFIDSFSFGDLSLKDNVIKKFIEDIYRCYDKKGAVSYEKLSGFYTDNFLKNSINLLNNVLELDEYTINFMKGKRFPISCDLEDAKKYKKCTFIKEDSIFYKFKDISVKEFEQYICLYLETLFKDFPSKEYLICDQMTNNGPARKKLNLYMIGNPIREIVVYRDPRDRYISIFKHLKGKVEPDINKYSISYKKLIDTIFNNQSPSRLMIRFEDMVLKYEETTKKIMDFIGMDPVHHVAPKSVFDPAISVVNIGAWRDFADQDFMKKIEENCSEYCYYPEKENLSEEALNLLKGNENA